jgi:hypothetical protein
LGWGETRENAFICVGLAIFALIVFLVEVTFALVLLVVKIHLKKWFAHEQCRELW